MPDCRKNLTDQMGFVIEYRLLGSFNSLVAGAVKTVKTAKDRGGRSVGLYGCIIARAPAAATSHRPRERKKAECCLEGQASLRDDSK